MKKILFILSLTLLLSACLSGNAIPEDQFKENQKIIGTFYLNEGQKGGPSVLDNGTTYLLDLDELDYSKEQYLDWEGQLVEVNGTIYVHYCLEYEQCLIDGVINSFTKIDSIELL